jgi:hypothetical protein
LVGISSVSPGSSGTGYVFASGLAPLGSNRTYRLWGAVNGQLISLRVFGPAPGIRAFTSDAADRPQAFAITAERDGGVVHTTHQPVVEATA